MVFLDEIQNEFKKVDEFGQVRNGLLLFINVRLGLDKLNPVYQPLLQVLLS